MKIAIIGSGISGLTCAYHLQNDHDLTIYEANNYIGGHTNTVDFELDGEQYSVDTGFIVFNERTYPNFIALMDELHVPSQLTSMGFSVSCEQTGLEYSGSGLKGLFAQKRNLFNLKFHRLLIDFTRFTKKCRDLLREPTVQDADSQPITLDEFIKQHRFSKMFVEKYLLPMGSAIWSCPRDRFLDFPAEFIAEFYENHGLLDITNRPKWRVISGGSKQYIDPLTKGFRDRIRLSNPVVAVVRHCDEAGAKSVDVTNNQGTTETFDQVIFACHSDQALRILGDNATELEKEVLSAFPYEPNFATLHTQVDLLPKNRNTWSSWNYLIPKSNREKSTLTYNMNILQSIQSEHTFSVTLNDDGRIRDENVIAEFMYHHPTFDVRRKEMQGRHNELIANDGISFCGAYWGNGFHEDGVNSGLEVVRKINRLNGQATRSSSVLIG